MKVSSIRFPWEMQGGLNLLAMDARLSHLSHFLRRTPPREGRGEMLDFSNPKITDLK
jgi:hypothetical protein